MIKTITFSQNLTIEEIINLLKRLKEEEEGTLKLQYSEFLCFKCKK